MLAFVEGKPAPNPTFKSLWEALNQRASIDPDRPAILSPGQPANLLEELVRPWPTRKGQNDDCSSRNNTTNAIGDGRETRTIRKLTSPACILNYLLSWILPIPAPAAEASYLLWSFAELQRATIRLCAFLRCRRGVQPGATAVFFSGVSAEWALLLSASALNRYTAVTLPNDALKAGNKLLQAQIEALAPSVIVVTTEAEARHVAGSVYTNIAVGISLEKFTADPPSGWISMADIAAETASQGPDYMEAIAAMPDEREHPKRAAFVVCTSGSTGKPKGCPMSAGYVLSALDFLSKQHTPLLPAPVAVVSGVSSQSRCQALTIFSWATGNAAVMDAGESSAETILETLRTCRPVSLSLLVTAVKSIARAPNYSPDAIKSVRFVNLTGSTVTMAILRVAQQTFPSARVLPTFAMTEAAGIAIWTAWYRPPTIDKTHAWRGIAASGVVAPGAALKVIGADGRRPVVRGEVGSLHIRGNSVIENYLGAGDRPGCFYEGEDGRRWFVSGDDAVISEEGFLHVLGRSEYTLRRDNEIVVPCTVENFLETEYHGASTAVVNITSSRGDAGIFAIFEDEILSNSPADIQDCVARKLGWAHRIEGAASLGAVGFQKWPLTQGGKIDYRRLRPAIEEYMAFLSKMQ
ncbi:fatty-acid-CoA ligase [Akanthomyces lecanii RCEF 1005]|uniref:Fatty-acid-CoA ligase n=1 Tax=Akanthomyces lecanii RCEF 1005 TaxID=1081108 RepID=A0A162KAW4_CORDF|nr:fatty-acid-CoA ligase [Akanthomyces lecanii RCEF 1005]